MPNVPARRSGWLAAVLGALLLPLDPLLGIVLMSVGLHRSRRRG